MSWDLVGQILVLTVVGIIILVVVSGFIIGITEAVKGSKADPKASDPVGPDQWAEWIRQGRQERDAQREEHERRGGF